MKLKLVCFWAVVLTLFMGFAPPVHAQSSSYVNSSDSYNWIDASTHNRLRAYSATYTYPENSASATVTLTVASPGLVNWTAHGFAANTIVILSTTGALPTGLTAGTVYYVRNPTANNFQLSAASGGASINFTGTQSGTHTARAQTSTITFPRTGPPYFMYTPTGISCGTSGTIIDDRISDEIDIGFSFTYGGIPFTKVRVNSNGRIQFNNNLTCGNGTDNGTPTIYTYDYPDANMNYSMRIYGADLDSSPKSFKDGTLAATPVNPTYNTNCLDDVQCYISVATIGSAPSRKFVVTWNNVPKWTTGAVIAGNFNLQLILEEGGDFVYQYGIVSDSQPNVPAQIGWQVNANDYDIKQTALPTNNSAIRYTVARPLIQYQMEQNSWTTAAGQVIDTSGNGYNGTRVGSAQTTASGYSCNGANIPANAGGTTDGINTGFNLLTQMGGAGTITFWYKPNAWVGASAAVVDGQLLDATNAANAFFYLSKKFVSTTTTKLRFAVRDSTGVTRFVETAAMSNSVLSASGWIHIGLSWNFNTLPGTNQDRLRIYINASAIGAGNTVQSAFSSTGTLATGIDTLLIGDKRSGNADGANSSNRSANGVIDEFRMYNLEAGYSQILTDYTRQVGCGNHYAITHAGSGASPTSGTSCSPNAVTITSHTIADVAIPSAATISLSTSTGKGTWSLTTGTGTFTAGPADSGSATYRFNNENKVVLALTHTTLGAVNINVTDGTFAENAGAEDADLNIAYCANPNFNGCEYTSGRCTYGAAGYDQLFTKLAGRAFKLDALAIDLSNTLATSFNGTVTVDLLANVSPTTPQAGTNCPASQTAVIPLGNVTFSNGRFPGTGLAVPANAFSSVSPNYSAYRDVRMRFTCNSTNCPPSGVQVCSRDAFAVRPIDFAFTANVAGDTTKPLLNPPSVTSGNNRVTAGVAFDVAAQAFSTGGGNATGYNGTPQIVTTAAAQSVSAQVAGATTLADYTDRLKGANVATPSLATLGTASAATGKANGQLYYLDYGGFRILAGGLQDPAFVDPSIDPPATDCVSGSSTNTDQDADPDREKFGCVVANQSNTALVGRFSPNSFLLTSSSVYPLTVGYVESTQVANSCASGNFTYEGQPFTINNVYVYALSSGAVIPAAQMPRYTAGVVTLGAENNNDGVNLSSRLTLNQSPAPAWSNGSYSISSNAVVFSRPTSPDGPFDLLDIGVQVTDPDGANLGTARNMLPTNNTVCTTSTCTHQKLRGVPPSASPPTPISMRYGQLRLQNAYGSERLSTGLPMPVEAQYWSAAGTFVRNLADSCTSLTTSNVNLLNPQLPVTAANVTVASAGTLTAGQGKIVLTQPNPNTPWANIGNVDVLLNLGATTSNICPPLTVVTPTGTSANLGFLATNGCGTATYTRNPTARASFGVYKSDLIYRRENY